ENGKNESGLTKYNFIYLLLEGYFFLNPKTMTDNVMLNARRFWSTYGHDKSMKVIFSYEILEKIKILFIIGTSNMFLSTESNKAYIDQRIFRRDFEGINSKGKELNVEIFALLLAMLAHVPNAIAAINKQKKEQNIQLPLFRF
ncbi:hypothetical protein ACJX0J_033001, partial [Zea mays]